MTHAVTWRQVQASLGSLGAMCVKLGYNPTGFRAVGTTSIVIRLQDGREAMLDVPDAEALNTDALQAALKAAR